MKIAFVTPAYYPATIGAAGYSTELAENLTRAGHTIEVFTPYVAGMEKNETINGVRIQRIDKIQLTESYYISVKMVREILKQRFDLIHSHHYGYFPATAGFIAAKLSKTAHVFGPYYHPPVYGIARKMLFAGYHLTQGLPILNQSDLVLPHTLYEKNLLLRLGATEENLRILPNLVNTDFFTPQQKKEKIVLFVSTLIPEKGAGVAMDIADKILSERKDVKFVFIGYAYTEEMRSKVQKLSRHRNVEFYRGLPIAELKKWYQRSMIMILPSKYEAFARVLAEGEACGCAIVSTRVGGIPEVAPDMKSGYLVDYGDWDGMKEKINYLLDNPGAAKRMGKSGAEHVRKNFGTKIIVKKLIRLYDEID